LSGTRTCGFIDRAVDERTIAVFSALAAAYAVAVDAAVGEAPANQRAADQ
jgi:hypothetical protein